MARHFNSRYIPFLCLALVYLPVIIYAKPITNSTFSFKDFAKDSSDFDSLLTLYGHAKLVNHTTNSIEISTGRVVCKRPIKLFDGTNPKRMFSFSTSFSVSISPGNSGLALFMVPIGFPVDVFDPVGSFGLPTTHMNKSTVLVQFDTHHVGININGSASTKSAKMNGGKKLQAWIDYQASSKRIEIRLGEIKPMNPLLSYRIDLSQVWNKGEMLVGISSSTTNASETCNVYSWSFQIRQVPHWLHSLPLNPKSSLEKTKSIRLVPVKQNECLFSILSALIVGIACGAAGTWFALFIRNRPQPIAPEELGQELEYKKVCSIPESIKDGKICVN